MFTGLPTINFFKLGLNHPSAKKKGLKKKSLDCVINWPLPLAHTIQVIKKSLITDFSQNFIALLRNY